MNKGVLPRAWLINKIKYVSDQVTSLEMVLKNEFNPSQEAIIINKNDIRIDSNTTGEVLIKQYSENEIILSVNTTGESFLVLSENYYPHWKAEIDGQETTIYQTNHILRGIEVPEGNHSVRFWYDNSKWKISRYISRSSLVLILMLLGFNDRRNILNFFRKRS